MRLRRSKARGWVYLVPALFFLAPALLRAQVETRVNPAREDRAALFESPAALIDPARIAALEEQAAGDQPDYVSIIEGARAQLQRYYGQFIEDQRILDQRLYVPDDPARLDQNTIRLLALAREMRPADPYFLGDAPYLFRLHRLLAQVYDQVEDPRRAIGEYAMALRYAGFPANALEPPPPTTDSHALRPVVLSMLRFFGDQERIAQEPAGAQVAAANRFRVLADQFNTLSAQLEEAEKDVFVAEAERARTGTDRVAAATARRDGLRLQYLATVNEIEEIRDGAYRTYETGRRQAMADVVFRIAIIARRLDLENKELLRRMFGDSFMRGTGDVLSENRTRHRDFGGYRILLEFAHRIDPENLVYLDYLADEYRTARDLMRAIAFAEKYIERARTLDPPPENLANQYLRLAGMYTDRQNYIRAAEAFEAYIAVAGAAAGPAALLNLADVHFERTGRFARARELYERYLLERGQAPVDLRERCEYHATAYRIQRNLASIARRERRTDPEKAALDSARESYALIEADYARSVEQEQDLRRQMLALKAQLRNRTEPDLEEQYYTLLERDIPEAGGAAGFLRSRLASLNVAGILERQAFLAARERRFRDAQSLYREIVSRGTGEQAVRARQNIERINLTLADGLLRPPVLPPDFER